MAEPTEADRTTRQRAIDELTELATHCIEYGLSKQSAAAAFGASYLAALDAIDSAAEGAGQ